MLAGACVVEVDFGVKMVVGGRERRPNVWEFGRAESGAAHHARDPAPLGLRGRRGRREEGFKALLHRFAKRLRKGDERPVIPGVR